MTKQPARQTFHKQCVILALLLTAVGCQSRPAIREVWSQKHIEAIGTADQDLFLTDRASRIRTESRVLPVSEQGEEFWVRWSGRDVEIVRFEYRQVNAPNQVSTLDFKADRRRATTFWIRGDNFQKAGLVSAWRMTLWHGPELLAEKNSSLW